MKLPRDRALALLTKCRGDEIWSEDHCRSQGVPEVWIAEMADAFESGYRSDRETIYVGNRSVNQYQGVRDFDLAVRLGQSLGLPVDRIISQVLGARAKVEAIKQAIMEGE